MKILFSPIGTADPLTALGDGPMLHIVRHFMPDQIVLYLTPTMSRYQREDARYTKAIELLAESQGAESPVIEVVESDFAEVYRFDHYISEFESILESLEQNAEGEPVLVNSSSGTAGMAQALVALGSFGRLNMTLLQVTTPKKGINGRNDREDPDSYDLAELWVWNEAIRGGDANRISVVSSPNFSDRLLRENAIALIKRFEYDAAFQVLNSIRRAPVRALELVRAASDRINLKGSLPAKAFAKSPLAYRANDVLAEYLYVMEVRLAQGHYAEFVRSVTPALTALIKKCLAPYLRASSFLRTSNGVATDEYDWDKIGSNPKLFKTLSRGNGSRPRFIDNHALVKLVEEYCEDDSVVSKIQALRSMEKNCRNLLAHTVVSSDKDQLEKWGGLKLEAALAYLFDLHGALEPGLYNRINDLIIKSM